VKQIETIHFCGSNCAPFQIQRGRNKWNVNYPFSNSKTYKHTFSKNVKEIPDAPENMFGTGGLATSQKRVGGNNTTLN